MIDFLNRVLDWLLKNDVSASEVIMNLLIIVVGISVLVSMWKLHRSNSIYQNFNVVSLMVNDKGFLDGAKCMEIGAWLLMSWGFVAQVTSGKLSDAYTAAYVGAFAMRGAFGAFLRSKGDPVLHEGTTTVTTTQSRATEVKP